MMQTPEPVHAEAARYATSLLFLPGLWAGPELWRGVAGYLAHRGWEGGLVDLRTTAGGLEGRAQAVADYAAGLPAPPVLVGHDAGGLVALTAARRGLSAAVVLVAPRGPAGAARRAIALGIYQMDPVTRRVNPDAIVNGTALARIAARVLTLRGASCVRGIPTDAILSTCGVSLVADDTPVSGRMATAVLERVDRAISR